MKWRSRRATVRGVPESHQGAHMKRFRYSLIAAVAVVVTALTASAALAATPILFTGKYAGQAATKVEGDVVTISATGTGKGTIIGAGTVTGQGTGDSSQQPCVPFGGTGKITGTAGPNALRLLTGANVPAVPVILPVPPNGTQGCWLESPVP